MKNSNNNSKDFLNIFANNKVLLFLIPNLICFYSLFYFYNQNFRLVLAVLFSEVLIGCFIYLVINTVIYYLLNKILKNKQKVFLVMCIISLFYSKKMKLVTFFKFISFIIVLIFIVKKFIKFTLDNIVGLISFITIILFSFTFINSLYNVFYLIVKSKDYTYEIDFKTDNTKNKPNIYWIHCDGMMNLNDMKKYFKVDLNYLGNYFDNNNYFYNNDAKLVAGHSTIRSLAALFNPDYYDNFYKDYLMDLEKVYLKEKKNTNFIVNYYELEEKRLNNELFQALGEQGYETIAIADYSPYSALYTDKFYDFYYYSDDGIGFHTPKEELRYINMENNSKFRLNSYIYFNHTRLLFYNTILYPLMENINYLDYNSLNYDDMNFDDYPYTKMTKYWNSKAIFKSIEDSYDNNKSQFTFIDYKLAHFPLFFTKYGDLLKKEDGYNLSYYVGNYIYAFNILTEMLDYIKTVDEDAVIIVQADHGIHVYEDWDLMNQLNINEIGLQEVRNSVINAVYVPYKYRNGDEDVLNEPLNISRYIVNNFVGDNYEYLD